MKVKVKILEKEKTVDLKPGSSVQDLLEKLKLNSEAFIVKKGNTVIIEKEKLKNNDRIELIKIISGG